MKSFVIDITAVSYNGLGIVGRRIITEQFPNRKEAMKYLCKNYYRIKINKITEMKKYIVKFFGSKNRREQIKQVKNMIVQASRATEVEDILRHKYGYEVINGLKIRECEQNENE
nr:MAG TPA: hypothetical protein [Caudoviricetes sp.]